MFLKEKIYVRSQNKTGKLLLISNREGRAGEEEVHVRGKNKTGKFGREIWLSRPGDLTLSCNPSYLGGQNSGMALGVHTSLRQRTDFRVRIMGINAVKWPRCTPEVHMTK
jgi:hypothetical protein